jgi:hypothetical protein
MSSINSGENIFLTENTSVKEVRLVNVAITDENTALNVIVSFLSLARLFIYPPSILPISSKASCNSKYFF